MGFITERQREDILRSLDTYSGPHSDESAERAQTCYKNARVVKNPKGPESETTHEPESPEKIIRLNQIRAAMTKVAQGEKMVIPPR